MDFFNESDVRPRGVRRATAEPGRKVVHAVSGAKDAAFPDSVRMETLWINRSRRSLISLILKPEK